MADSKPNRNIMSVSWGDHLEAWDGDDAMDQPDKILRCAERWQTEFGAGAIYWREMRSWSKFRIGFTPPGAPPRKVFDDYERKGYDEHELITTQVKEMGYKVYMYATMFDEGFPLSEGWQGGIYGWQSQFTMANPEYLARDKEDRPHFGIMEYSYPDVRRYTIRRILSALGDYDFDGVFVCTRSQSKPAVHGDQFGFNEPVIEEYERRYGVDMMRRNFDLEPWRRLRGEGVTQFLRELRSALDARGMKLGIGVPTGNYIGPPLGNLHLDWRTWVEEKLVDDLVIDQVAVRCPSFWHLMWPKNPGYGYRVNDEDHYGIKGGDDYGEKRFWSIPLVKGSPAYEGAMERLYGVIRNDYGPHCARHGCRLHLARMWSVHDPEEEARLLDTEGVSGLAIGSFGAVVDRRAGGVRPDVANPA